MTLVPSQTPIQWVELAVFLGVKQPVQKADYSSLYSANIKNGHSYRSTTHAVHKGTLLYFTLLYILYKGQNF